jgi:hypothetical protein
VIPGITVKLGGRDFVVPPVTRGLLKKYRQQFKEAAGGNMAADDQFDFFGDIAFDCIKRNYPDLTEAEFDDLLDLTTAAQAFGALMCDFEGVKRAGEMVAALQSGISIGITTPPESAATPDGTGTPPSN